MEIEKIYVELKNEGTKVWRPVFAEKLHNGIYKINENLDINFEDEELEFLPGEIVICEMQSNSNGNILVATNLASL